MHLMKNLNLPVCLNDLNSSRMELLEKYALRILEVKGLNPVKSSIMSKLNAIFWITMDSSLTVAILMELFSNNLDIFTAVDNFPAVTTGTKILAKEIGLFTHLQEFRTVINCTKEFWPKDKFGKQIKDKLENIESIGKKFLQIFILSVIAAGSLYMLKPILEGNHSLPIRWVTFCSLEESLSCYIFNYIVQVVWVFFGLSVLVGFDSVFILLLMCGYCELEQIKHVLISMDPDETTDEDGVQLLDLISSVIEQHNRVFKILRYFNKSLSVADAAYASKWWIKSQPKLRKMILLIILRSQRPVEMTAGGVLVLNFETFVAIMKATGSALTFLNTLCDEEE
ncbi:7tm Odorant receptor [Popillia japonica]|uniref:7tm Odorant receptor n=1 Tax=Popillia japonica TaxID=7064 RepID=A0AAW1LTK6_POPJA